MTIYLIGVLCSLTASLWVFSLDIACGVRYEKITVILVILHSLFSWASLVTSFIYIYSFIRSTLKYQPKHPISMGETR